MKYLDVPVGRCIYCGAVETEDKPLRPEHIIALALNGDKVLQKASCDDCAKLTGKIEGYNTQKLGLFGPTRYVHKMRSRKRSKWPKALPVTAKDIDGPEITFDVPISEYPATFTVPILPPARYFTEAVDDGRPVEKGSWWTWYQKGRLLELARKHGFKDGVQFTTNEVNTSKFSQMLAKIGHLAAVAHYGVDGFSPMAIDLALGRSESINFLVGCNEAWEPQPPPA